MKVVVVTLDVNEPVNSTTKITLIDQRTIVLNEASQLILPEFLQDLPLDKHIKFCLFEFNTPEYKEEFIPLKSYSRAIYEPKQTADVVSSLFPEVKDTTDLDDDAKSYLVNQIYPTLTQGLTFLCKEKPTDPMKWLGEWLLQNNPSQPQISI